MHIDHMKLTCTTDDNQHGFICGVMRDHGLLNVMVMTLSGWKSRIYHRDRITLTEDAYKNVDAAQLETLGFQRPEPVVEKLIQVGDKVLWLYTAPRGWNESFWVRATVVKLTKKRVTIDTEKPDGSFNCRVSVRPDKLKHREAVSS